MPTAILAAIAPFEVVRGRKDQKTLRRVVVILIGKATHFLLFKWGHSV